MNTKQSFSTRLASATALWIALAPLGALAGPGVPGTHKYTRPCQVGKIADVCTIVDNRDANGALQGRGVYSNAARYTHKMVWVEGVGFMSSNSIDGLNNRMKVEYSPFSTGGTQIDAHAVVHQLSWD